MEEKQPQKGFFKRVLTDWKTWATAVVILFLINVFGQAPEKSTQNSVTPTKQEEVKANTEVVAEIKPIEISAANLEKEYKANEVAADTKYKGKIVKISGTVASVDKDILDNPLVRIETNEMFNSVVCRFGKGQIDDLSKLIKGQKVTFIGEVSGMTIGSVYIKSCSF